MTTLDSLIELTTLPRTTDATPRSSSGPSKSAIRTQFLTGASEIQDKSSDSTAVSVPFVICCHISTEAIMTRIAAERISDNLLLRDLAGAEGAV